MDPNGIPYQFDAPVMNEVLKVNHQKRLAATLLSQAVTCVNKADQQHRMEMWYNAEKELAHDRVVLLNKCLQTYNEDAADESLRNMKVPETIEVQSDQTAPPPDTGFILKSDGSITFSPKACVTYRRFRSNTELENQDEIQDPISFSTSMAYSTVYELMTNHQNNRDNIAKLYYAASTSSPRTVATKTMLELLSENNEVKWDLKRNTGGTLTSGPWFFSEASTEPFFVWENEASGNVAARHMVLLGPMDMNVCHEYDNPTVQRIVREIIIGDASRKIETFGNGDTTKINEGLPLLAHIKIHFEGENHILSFTPFSQPDHCLVAHLVLQQNNGTRCRFQGILNPPMDVQNQEFKHLLEQRNAGDVTWLDASFKPYYCLGASRGMRWGEAQLARVNSKLHRRLWYTHPPTSPDDAGQFLPNPYSQGFDTENPHVLPGYNSHVPMARVARFAFKNWDVVASSYHTGAHAENVHTVITAVCYPPYLSRVFKSGAGAHSSIPRNPSVKAPEADVWDRGCNEDFYIKLMLGDEDTRDNRLYYTYPKHNTTLGNIKRDLLTYSRKIKQKISLTFTHQWDRNLSFFQNVSSNQVILDAFRNDWKKYIADTLRRGVIFGPPLAYLPGMFFYSRKGNERNLLIEAVSLDQQNNGAEWHAVAPDAFVDGLLTQYDQNNPHRGYTHRNAGGHAGNAGGGGAGGGDGGGAGGGDGGGAWEDGGNGGGAWEDGGDGGGAGGGDGGGAWEDGGDGGGAGDDNGGAGGEDIDGDAPPQGAGAMHAMLMAGGNNWRKRPTHQLKAFELERPWKNVSYVYDPSKPGTPLEQLKRAMQMREGGVHAGPNIPGYRVILHKRSSSRYSGASKHAAGNMEAEPWGFTNEDPISSGARAKAAFEMSKALSPALEREVPNAPAANGGSPKWAQMHERIRAMEAKLARSGPTTKG